MKQLEYRGKWSEERKRKAVEASTKHWHSKGRYAKYGITKQAYDEMEHQQGYKCAACRENRPLVIDHDHRTGRVRGLLCRQCNVALGLLKENVDTLYALIALVLYREEGEKRG